MTEDNFVDFKCPYCGDMVSFPADTPSVLQECPNCSEGLLFPEAGNEMGRPIPVPLSTARLTLRRLGVPDWKDMLEILSDDETFRYVDGQTQEEEQVLRWLEADGHIRLTTLGEAYCLGIVLTESGKLIGYTSLTFRDQTRRQAVLGIFLNRGHQKQGFATEAIGALLGFCFADLKLHRITADCDSRNVAARRVFEKAGMVQEGEFRQSHFVHGEWINTVWYAMLGEEYGGGQAAPPAAN